MRSFPTAELKDSGRRENFLKKRISNSAVKTVAE